MSHSVWRIVIKKKFLRNMLKSIAFVRTIEYNIDTKKQNKYWRCYNG